MKKDPAARMPFVFEHHRQPLLSRAAYVRRVVGHVAVAFGIIFGSLGLGVLGYRALEHMPWLDALLNAAMILGGMGPVDPLHTASGKLFASFYALYSGIVFLVVAGVMFAPFMHRLLHSLHLETDEDSAR